METVQVSTLVAFLAGILGFLSPCQLALMPGYISYLSGASLERDTRSRFRLTVHAVFFVLGLALALVALGASVGLVGYVLQDYVPVMRRVGGILLIVLGMYMAGVLKIGALDRSFSLKLGQSRRSSLPRSFVLGAVFGVGWTPCVGPTLGAILVLAGNSTTWAQGAVLLAAYSLCLGVPFVVTAVALERVSSWIRRFNQHGNLVAAVTGALLVLMGVLMFSGQMDAINRLLGSWTVFDL
jgi:cytochrome c-type biogenesis protein